MKTILTIDDEPGVLQSYRMMLGDLYRVLPAENGLKALRLLDDHHVDLILLDLTMPEMNGMAFLKEIDRRGDCVPVVVVTASNSVRSAVDAMKAGAREYVIKPFEIDEIYMLVERILAQQSEQNELIALRQVGATGFDALVGDSTAFRRAVDMARQAAMVDSTVLITGESGTGKDMLARAIQSGGRRAAKAYVPLSCCAIPAQLFESELFGHERGAFTGATDRHLGKMQVADGGTLFLDEIGEMPLETQAKLLRAIQEGSFYPIGSTKVIEVDIRIICATNRVLPDEIRKGTFRQDLFYRVNVLPIEMPALRQRREDIPRLVAHFVAKHAPRVNSPMVTFHPKAMGMLLSYSWPGNVRELENMVERILVCNRGRDQIGPDCLRGMLPDLEPGEGSSGIEEFEGLPLEEAVSRLERHLILRALERSNSVQSRAADLLGTTRRILKYKMDQLQIDTEPDSKAESA